MAKKIENGLPEIGYLYHYPRLDNPTEKFRLDIFISSIPTEKHFDVLRASFLVKIQEKAMQRLTITHPWVYEKVARVCAGVIVLEDRNRKEEAFTFGGQVEIKAEEMQTICRMVSTAPILEISRAIPIQRLFIEELEIIFAERQARHTNRHEYEEKLGKADPLDLYLACIKELREKFERFPHMDDEYLHFIRYLHTEERRLDAAGLFRKPRPRLEDIL